MPLNEPSWWYGRNRAMAGLLSPAAFVYGWIAQRRFQAVRGYSSCLPVICVGNFTAGGTGKTPTAIALGVLLKKMGERPAFLTRGYGGSIRGPHWVDRARDIARDTGDEPLLLAAHAPTMIARERCAGAIAIEAGCGNGAIVAGAQDPTVIIMDDGLQNPSLEKDLTLALVSVTRGIGNGRVIPAGPLRAPLKFQLELADLIVFTGHDAGAQRPILDAFTGPVMTASTQAQGDLTWLSDKPVLAFAGIAAPERFYDLLSQLGARLVATRSFKDHQSLRDDQARELLDEASKLGAQIVTSEKDLVRLGQSDLQRELAQQTRALSIIAKFEADDVRHLKQMLEVMLSSKRAGSPGD